VITFLYIHGSRKYKTNEKDGFCEGYDVYSIDFLSAT
jgi:hypothetical protein